MTICNIDDTITQINAGQRLMGLDVGKKTIGIALGDPGHKIASPHRILWRQKFSTDMAELFNEMEKLAVGGLVIDAFGRLPEINEVETIDKLKFKVIAGDSRKITRVQVSLIK